MIVYLSLGANMGDKADNLQTAINCLNDSSEFNIIAISDVYETEPWGGVEQDSFFNLIVKAETTLRPTELLYFCQSIENRLGRKREVHWGPRLIDIDILIYDNVKINTEELTLPHPYIEQREFVLAPLREIEPELILPSGKHISEIAGEGKIKKLDSQKISF